MCGYGRFWAGGNGPSREGRDSELGLAAECFVLSCYSKIDRDTKLQWIWTVQLREIVILGTLKTNLK